MFSNLSQNSIIYVLNTKDSPKLSTGQVINVSLPRPKNAIFGQTFDTVVDITAMVEGERREFKQVPANTTTANFGPEAFVLADGKESINAYISAALQNSKNVVASYEKHKRLIDEYEGLLQELNPALKADKEKDKAIQSL